MPATQLTEILGHDKGIRFLQDISFETLFIMEMIVISQCFGDADRAQEAAGSGTSTLSVSLKNCANKLNLQRFLF